MPKIFVSYRRVDSQERAHRIADWLVNKYELDNVFVDVDRIPGATDFEREIEKSLNDSDVVLVVIGKLWASEIARRSTIDAVDYVRFEVAKSLHDGLTVIPVLMDDDVASLLDSNLLTDDVRAILSLNFMTARGGRDFHQDMERIRAIIDSAPELDRNRDGRLKLDDYRTYSKIDVDPEVQQRSRRPLIGFIVAIVLGIMGIGLFALLTSSSQPDPNAQIEPQNLETQAALILTEQNLPTVTETPDTTLTVDALIQSLLASETANAQETLDFLVAETANAQSTQDMLATETANFDATTNALILETADAQETQDAIFTATANAQATIDLFTATPTPSNTPTETNTPSPTPNETETQIALATQNMLETSEASTVSAQLTANVPTNTPTDTPTNTPTDTPTETPTDTSTPTDTPSPTPTDTPSPTATDTPTQTWTPSPTPTFTPDATETAQANMDASATQIAIQTQVFEQAVATENAQATAEAEIIPFNAPQWVGLTTSNATLRSDANANAGVVAGLSANERLDILEWNNDGWYRVRVSDTGVEGWVATFLVEVTGDFGLRQETFSNRHLSNVTSLAYSPDGQLIASGGQDTTLKLWDANTGTEIATFTEHNNIVEELSFSANSELLASYSEGIIIIRDMPTGAVIRSVTIDDYVTSNLAFSADNTLLIWGEPTIKILDIVTGVSQFRSQSSRIYIVHIEVDPNGRIILSFGSDESIGEYDVSNQWELDLRKNDVNSSPFSRLISVHQDNQIYASLSRFADDENQRCIVVRDIETFETIQTLRCESAFDDDLRDLELSPDGNILAGLDVGIWLWDVNTGALIRVLVEENIELTSMAFSPDGQRLVTGDTNGNISTWDLSVPDTSNTIEASSVSPTITLIPTSENSQIQIIDIIGQTNLGSEAIVIQNQGSTIDISGWTLEDTDGNVFVFPEQRLFGNATLTVYTRDGEKTPVTLFWGLSNAILETGDIVTLKDSLGNVQSTQHIVDQSN